MPERRFTDHLPYLDTLLVSTAEKAALVREYWEVATPVIEEVTATAKDDLTKTDKDAAEATSELGELTKAATALQIGLKQRRLSPKEALKSLQALQREHELLVELHASLIHAEERATYVRDFPLEYDQALREKYKITLPWFSV